MINRELIKVGDRIELPVYPERKPLPGEVIYVHPQRRYFRARFISDGGPIIESFNLYGPISVSASKNQVKEDF